MENQSRIMEFLRRLHAETNELSNELEADYKIPYETWLQMDNGLDVVHKAIHKAMKIINPSKPGKEST